MSNEWIKATKTEMMIYNDDLFEEEVTLIFFSFKCWDIWPVYQINFLEY